MKEVQSKSNSQKRSENSSASKVSESQRTFEQISTKVSEEICKRLSLSIKNPKSELRFQSPYQFVVSVVLSAQTTDVQVNKATAVLYKECPTIDDILNLGVEGLQDRIKSIGFFRNKAKNVIALSKMLKEKFGGEIPNNREDLESLPGVGRKTSNVILNTLFEEDTIAVDTHVLRLSKRLGFSDSSDPLKVEADLEKIVPQKYKGVISNLLVLHGRYVCKAQKPKCEECCLRDICRFFREKDSEKPYHRGDVNALFFGAYHDSIRNS